MKTPAQYYFLKNRSIMSVSTQQWTPHSGQNFENKFTKEKKGIDIYRE
jgi:hypothetical protein